MGVTPISTIVATNPMDRRDDTFELGLVLAGAVPAGAYTAGVLDFLIEALDNWEEAKRSDDLHVPRHNVKLRAITGSSANGMVDAIKAAMVGSSTKPKNNRSARRVGFIPLYKAWVKQVDISCVFVNTHSKRANSLPVIPDTDVRFFDTDREVNNNKTIELACHVFNEDRKSEEQDGRRTRETIILIDPVSETQNPSDTRMCDDELPLVLQSLSNNLNLRARLAPEELVSAQDKKNYTRFLIAPRRCTHDGRLQAFPLAGSGFEGFTGFLSEKFRHHDFMLGRRNCQRFLQSTFCLPMDNPIVAHWTPEMDSRHGVWGDTGESDAPMRPLIPLYGHAAEECLLPEWASLSGRELKQLKKMAKRRIKAIKPRLLRSLTGKRRNSWFASLALGGNSRRLTRLLMKHVEADLVLHQQYDGPLRYAKKRR